MRRRACPRWCYLLFPRGPAAWRSHVLCGWHADRGSEGAPPCHRSSPTATGNAFGEEFETADPPAVSAAGDLIRARPQRLRDSTVRSPRCRRAASWRTPFRLQLRHSAGHHRPATAVDVIRRRGRTGLACVYSDGAVKSGFPLGASRPPSGSSVTATVWPGSTRRVNSATPGSSNRPAARGIPSSNTQIS